MAAFRVGALPTLDQSLPVLGGVRVAQDLMRQHLRNQAMQQQNQFAPDMNQAKLAQSLLQNQSLQHRNEIAPDMDAARLAQILAQNKLTESRTAAQDVQNQQAPDLLELRRRGLDISDRRLGMQQDYNKLQREKMTAQLGNMLSRIGRMPGGQDFLTKNPDFARDFLQGVANAANQFSNQSEVLGEPGQEMPDALTQMVPQVTDDQVRGAQEATKSSLIKAGTPVSVQNQMYRGRTVGTLLNDSAKVMDDIAKYFGPKGAILLAQDKAAAALGKDVPSYGAYMNYTNNTLPLLTGEIIQLLGLPRTNESRQEIANMLSPKTYATNPKIWKDRQKELIRQINAIEPTYRQTLAQVQQASPQAGAPAMQEMSAMSAPLAGGQQPVVMQAPDGQRYEIPASDVQAAMAAGLKEVG